MNQESANQGLWAESGSPPVLTNEVLKKHSQLRQLHNIYDCFHAKGRSEITAQITWPTKPNYLLSGRPLLYNVKGSEKLASFNPLILKYTQIKPWAWTTEVLTVNSPWDVSSRSHTGHQPNAWHQLTVPSPQDSGDSTKSPVHSPISQSNKSRFPASTFLIWVTCNSSKMIFLGFKKKFCLIQHNV